MILGKAMNSIPTNIRQITTKKLFECIVDMLRILRSGEKKNLCFFILYPKYPLNIECSVLLMLLYCYLSGYVESFIMGNGLSTDFIFE